MRLAYLRHQMLIAMGLPACWIQQAPDPSTPPPPDQGPPLVTTRPADPPPDDPWRGSDVVVQQQQQPPHRSVAVATGSCTHEQVCGRSDTRHGSNTCGPYGNSLESFGANTHLPVTRINFGANPPELATFTLDPQATASYQRTVSITGPTLPLYCCYSQCTLVHHASPPPLQATAGKRVVTSCVPAPSIQASKRFSGGSVTGNPECAAFLDRMPYTSGTSSQCCYGRLVDVPPPDPEPYERKHYRGRAARVEGTPRVAPVHAGTSWQTAGERVEVATLTEDVRGQLVDAWTKTAQMEHASIAAFSALSLRLLALGAPAELVARTHEAALDEIRHAQVAFALASAYARAPLAPARFDDAAKLATSGTLVDLAVETFVDGCINEGTAALEASLAAERASDPVVAGVLHAIAAEEARHAELAWAIVAWCVRAEPSVVTALRAALARVREATGEVDTDATVEAAADASPLARHGVLAEATLHTLRATTLRDVVAPCLAALADAVPQA